MKSTILNVRIPVELKNSLEKIIQSEKTTISDLVRDILQVHVEDSENYFANIFESLKTVKYNSNDFIYLISWIYEKRVNYSDSNSEDTLIKLKSIIIKIIKDDDYPENLKIEFEKVFFDIIRFCNEQNNRNRQFTFGIANQHTSFNYSVLKEFINYNGFSINTISH